MGRLVGYARVSTGEQDLQLQMDALKTAGCSGADIYTDKASGARGNRPGLDACVKALEPGEYLGRLAPGSPGAFDATLGGSGGRVAGQGHRLPVALRRRHRHDHGVGRVDVQYLLKPGTVRAAPDPGAHPSRACCCKGAGPQGRPPADPP